MRELPFGISIALCSLVFFTIGAEFKKIEQFLDEKKAGYWVIAVLAFSLGSLLANINGGVNLYRLSVGKFPLLYILNASLLVFPLYAICKKIGNCKWIEYIGKHSLDVLCLHFIIMIAIQKIEEIAGVTGRYVPYINIILIISIVLIIAKIRDSVLKCILKK